MFFSPDLLESVLEDKFHREKKIKNTQLGPRIFSIPKNHKISSKTLQNFS